MERCVWRALARELPLLCLFQAFPQSRALLLQSAIMLEHGALSSLERWLLSIAVSRIGLQIKRRNAAGSWVWGRCWGSPRSTRHCRCPRVKSRRQESCYLYALNVFWGKYCILMSGNDDWASWAQDVQYQHLPALERCAVPDVLILRQLTEWEGKHVFSTLYKAFPVWFAPLAFRIIVISIFFEYKS